MESGSSVAGATGAGADWEREAVVWGAAGDEVDESEEQPVRPVNERTPAAARVRHFESSKGDMEAPSVECGSQASMPADQGFNIDWVGEGASRRRRGNP